MRTILLALLLGLCSCSAIQEIKEVALEAKKLIADLHAPVAKLDAGLLAIQTALPALAEGIKAAREKLPAADVNKDGTISGWGEWAKVVGILAALGMAYFADKKGTVAKVTAERVATESNEHYDTTKQLSVELARKTA